MERPRKVKVRKGDGSVLVGNFLMSTLFQAMDSSAVLGKFDTATKVLDGVNRDVILELSWLTENRFFLDTHDGCLRNVHGGQVIPGSVR